jgi:broad specificity phosphatase PhoE
MNARLRLALVFLFAWLIAAPSFAQRAIILVRHAEKADAPAADPPLTAEGEARAKKLAIVLRDAGVGAIYSTSYVRTMKTAEPLSTALKVPVTATPANVGDFVTILRTKHGSDTVLVVGHSNTVPELLQALGCRPPITIADNEYDYLFVVTPRPDSGAPVLVRLRY